MSQTQTPNAETLHNIRADVSDKLDRADGIMTRVELDGPTIKVGLTRPSMEELSTLRDIIERYVSDGSFELETFERDVCDKSGELERTDIFEGWSVLLSGEGK